MHRTQGIAGSAPGRGARIWGWISAGVVALILFVVLYDNGALFAPLVGESAYTQNYLHEFFHDARHLLGVPGH
ncbi:Hypothetical Protein RradSPS_0809 [Rubrobacter radiotolerans]|uniref:CbtB-domain containing protein n=1 Tax=Rubrobacter radiotolerans TaxID=42256 RepID=A0A023X0W9_RUBRA|nr:CbtB-domain containing protein [Rubrobacter radiotolerans]AHY46092.1 Hypothetical Protein RradSPS_0809 [Rubrobacter radiotolerans]MDX5893502.1 CbtB-domain containing protein [Rubrobacter radiotolerans]SMC03863.1 Probable cobalt transporter subunit (CbtB) [Rubrobacter radiotolerans DSM 5868]